MKVVFADDSAEMRKRIKASLGQVQCVENIYEAENGVAVFELISTHKPELVILDIRMPAVDGLTVLRNVKYMYPYMVVVILTNFPLDRYRENCLEAGADYFLDKSMDFHKLPEVVREVAGRKQCTTP